jgi:8-oxo-dGTP pyrophosphatase MutT (NUDIX family)
MSREELIELVWSIEPLDEREANDMRRVTTWLEGNEPIYRVQKPDVPPMHLVSYFAIVDPKSKKMLLQDHLLAKLWVPAGGHVDPNEDPADTALRECKEELGFATSFLGERKPHFVTATTTNGQGQHTDVSLWYVLAADEATPLMIEDDKFNEVRWWKIDDILSHPISLFDPELHRFLAKVTPLLKG